LPTTQTPQVECRGSRVADPDSDSDTDTDTDTDPDLDETLKPRNPETQKP